MRTILRHAGSSLLALAAVAASACTMDKQEAPTSLIGPAGLSQVFGVSASPDILPRDGAARSTITVTARDAKGDALAGKTVRLSASAGTLSAAEVTTDASGRASTEFTAPTLAQGGIAATITATPMGGDFDQIRTQAITIALIGPALPSAAFTFSPETPGQFDVVTFDASSTTLSGVACAANCSYFWEFGDSTIARGRNITHRFESQGVFLVTLTVESAGGVTNSTTRAVTVGAPQAITASISVSPTDPEVGDTVFVDGRASTTPDGVEITDYLWDFGDGHTATGPTATNVYTAARTYTIRLIITDRRGRTGTTTTTISVDPMTIVAP